MGELKYHYWMAKAYVMKWLWLTRFRWRLHWGFCPLCNSSAPEIDTCLMCFNHREPFPPEPETITEWRKSADETARLKFITLKCIAEHYRDRRE